MFALERRRFSETREIRREKLDVRQLSNKRQKAVVGTAEPVHEDDLRRVGVVVHSRIAPAARPRTADGRVDPVTRTLGEMAGTRSLNREHRGRV